MGLIAKKKASVPAMDAGTYMAVCVGVVDLGEQHSAAFKKYDNRVLIIFEIPSLVMEVDGELKPRWLSKEVSPSLNEKSNLYQMLTSWRGKKLTEEEQKTGFDISSMAGKGCMLQVITEEKESGCYNKITSVIGIPAGMPAPKQMGELIVFNMDEWEEDVFVTLPEWVQEKIKKSTEYQQKYAPKKMLDAEYIEPNTQASVQSGGCPI